MSVKRTAHMYIPHKYVYAIRYKDDFHSLHPHSSLPVIVSAFLPVLFKNKFNT